ncbi:GumC family protein [Sphingomonas faeni]|uniref:GumC family protein n=1 Tax=Sphingomonas faeni TaxID=185950 RepID=UPI0020BFC339|nr:AAA family ATPase [Sphingomonas faeni]MCK8458386.1 AAA family ATPase [Sphingomonas faeni]
MVLERPGDLNGPAMPPSGVGVIRSLSGAVKAMFLRRWRTFVAVAVTVLIVGIALVMMMPWRYEAVARVKIDPSANAALGRMDGERPDQNIFDTEVNVVKSRDVAIGVVRKLGLADNAELTKGLPEIPGKPTEAQTQKRIDLIASRLLSKISAERDKMTYVVNIGYTAADRMLAAEVANGFAGEYIAYSRGQRTGAASRETSYLDQRLAALNRQAALADARLAQYRAQAGIVGGGSSTVTDQQISPLAGQLATAESEAAAAQARLAVAGSQIRSGGIDAVSAVLDSKVIADLRSQRAQIVQRQGEVLSRYGSRHPESVKITEQLSAIDKQIQDEANRNIGGLRSEASAAAARAGSLRSEMGKLRGQQSSDTRASALAETYQRQADAAHAAYNRLAEQAQTMNGVARSSLTQAQIIESAIPPTAPTSPNRPMLVILTIIAALAAGTVVIGAQEVLAKGLYSIDDLEELGLPVLATIPKLRSAKLSPTTYLVDRPMSAYAEAFRTLRRSIGPAKSVAIVSTLPNEGKTSSALALARICAMAKERVLLIDADLRRAGLIEAAGISPERGLVELLRGEATLADVLLADAVPGLDLIPVARSSFIAEDLFAGDALENLVASQMHLYDRIIIDTPPLLGVADARSAANVAERTVLVVKWGATPENAVRSALNWLVHDGVNVAGAVFSMVEISSEAYGGLYYSRKYANYYNAD